MFEIPLKQVRRQVMHVDADAFFASVEQVMKLPALTDGVSRLRRSFATIQAPLVRNLLCPALQHTSL